MRFYFDFLSHNEEIRDCEGVELADWLTAHRHAVQIVKQTVPFLPKGLDWRGLRIQVRDECRRHVLSVLFPAASRYAALLTQSSLKRTTRPCALEGEAARRPTRRRQRPAWALVGGAGKAVEFRQRSRPPRVGAAFDGGDDSVWVGGP